MGGQYLTQRRRWIVPTMGALVLLGASFAYTSNAALAGGPCKLVFGTMDEFGISTDPLINGGTLKGSLKGDYTFTLTNMTPSTTPDVILFSGESEIETSKGDLEFTEAGSLDTQSPGRFADLLTITEGTGKYEGATGQIYLIGNFDIAAGGGHSYYHGTICTP